MILPSWRQPLRVDPTGGAWDIGFNHGVLGLAENPARGTGFWSQNTEGVARGVLTEKARPECCAGSGSTNHDSADRMSGQFLFYHEKEAKHNDKSRDDHDDERHAESPWLTTPLWWWKRP